MYVYLTGNLKVAFSIDSSATKLVMERFRLWGVKNEADFDSGPATQSFL